MKGDICHRALSTSRRCGLYTAQGLRSLRYPARAIPKSTIGTHSARHDNFSVRVLSTASAKTRGNTFDHEDLFRYTSGRWLWDEEQQLRDRYKAFNVAELQRAAAKAIGSDRCVSITKLAEGGYNKVFRLIMDDGKTVLARIPNPNAGPPFYTTASEVATMEFARSILQIPIPRVLPWSATANNPVQSEYIIMEEAAGAQLAMTWDDLSRDSKLSVMREIVSLDPKMLSMSFFNYGSIYFANDAVESAIPAKLTSEAPSETKEQISKTFYIGSTVDRGFWKKERSSRGISRGPWSTPADYALSLGQREIDWIKNYAIPRPSSDATWISSAQNDPQAHFQLLRKYLQVARSIVDIKPTLKHPTLWHPDLHSSNLFVNNDGQIMAVIDWQGSWAGPIFLQAVPSPLLDYQGSMLLKRPDNFDDLDDERKTQIKQKIFKSTLFQLYLLETEKRNPMLTKAFHLNHGKTRRILVELAGNTWDDDIVSFREALINVERNWHEDEPRSHSVDAEGWNEVHDFFDRIKGLVKRDGWTSSETFDTALKFFSKLRQRAVEHMKGEERDNFERQTRSTTNRR